MTAVFIVEDEPLAAEAHAAIVGRMPGFRVIGTAGTVAASIAALTGPERLSADVVLLDLHLPDGSGLEVCARLRRAGLDTAVIAVTADRDLRAVKGALGSGVVDYLLKPFTQRLLVQKLERVAAISAATPQAVSQWAIDQAFTTLRIAEPLQKGLQPDTLDLVKATIAASGAVSVSAAEVAERAGLSRPTARRYLEHLAEAGAVVRAPRYGRPGRPEFEYRPVR